VLSLENSIFKPICHVFFKSFAIHKACICVIVNNHFQTKRIDFSMLEQVLLKCCIYFGNLREYESQPSLILEKTHKNRQKPRKHGKMEATTHPSGEKELPSNKSKNRPNE